MCCQPGIESLTNNQFQDYCKEVREKETCQFYNNAKTTEGKIFLEEIKDKILHVEELINLASKKDFCPYEITLLKIKNSVFKFIIGIFISIAFLIPFNHEIITSLATSPFSSSLISASSCSIVFSASLRFSAVFAIISFDISFDV